MRTRSSRRAPKRKRRLRRTRSSSRTRKKSKKKRKKKSSSPALTSPRAQNKTAVRVLLGLGSNLGDRRGHLEAALKRIGRIAPFRRVSSFYRSDPVGYPDQPDFCNLAAEITWRGSPEDLLEAVKRVERRVGRTPRFRDGPREIDIDILDFGGQIRHSPGLSLPHPRLEIRRFALEPLAEIAPRWRHPISGLTARQLMKTLPARPGAWRSTKKLRIEN